MAQSEGVAYTFVPVGGRMPINPDPLARALGDKLGSLGYPTFVEPVYDGFDRLRGLKATPGRPIGVQHLQAIRTQGFELEREDDTPRHTENPDYQASFVA